MKISPREEVGEEVQSRLRTVAERNEACSDKVNPLLMCGSFDLSPRLVSKSVGEVESPQFGRGVWRPVAQQRQRSAKSTLPSGRPTSFSVETEISPVVTSPSSDSTSSTDESEISSTTSTVERSPSPPASPERDRLDSDKLDCLNMPPPALGPLASFHKARPNQISVLSPPSSVSQGPHRDEHASDSEASCRSTPPGDISSRNGNPIVQNPKPQGPGPGSLEDQTGKKRRRDKTNTTSASRLSFADDLDDESSSNEMPVSMSMATQKRFRQEERTRRPVSVPVVQSACGGSTALYTVPVAQVHDSLTSLQSCPTGRIVDDDEEASRVRPLTRVSCDVCERQGKRPYMEDTFFIHRDYITVGSHLFAVFDGHGGSRASVYSRNELPAVLQRHLALQGIDKDTPPAVRSLGAGQEDAADESMRNAQEAAVATAFSATFLEIDRLFLDIARSEGLRDGTTALVALLRENRLHVGWVGDSRGILCRRGRFVRVSEDHKPDRPEERRAVEARGGTVIFRGTFRVAGPTALAVSRAIGDILMKEPRRLVVADAETKCFDLSPQDEFLVMASDGLFDVMGDQGVVDIVSKYLREHDNCCTGAAERLTDLALEKGSTDNVTVLVVQFLWSAASA